MPQPLTIFAGIVAAIAVLAVIVLAVRLAPSSVTGAPERNPVVGTAIVAGLMGAATLGFAVFALRTWLKGDVRLPADLRSPPSLTDAVSAVPRAPDFPSRLAAVRRAVGTSLLSSSATFAPSTPSLPSGPFLFGTR